MRIFLLLWSAWMVSGYSGSSRLQKFAPSNQRFSADVYKELAKTETGNFMASPLSLEIVLALVAAGAKGVTGNQIRAALRLPTTQTEINSIFSEVVQTLRSTGNYTLATANRLFVREGFQVKDSYRHLASRSYNAGAENLDFSNAQQSADLINEWVEQQTNDKIKGLVSDQQITPDLVLVLVNTLYLNANWSEQFSPVPGKQTFFGVDGKPVPVETMTLTSYYNYYDSQELDCQILEVPYVDHDISMIIALPKQRNGLAGLEKRVDELLSHDKFSREKVAVRLPKFSTETSIKFVPILKSLGVKMVFTDAANLSGIADNLQVSDVVQKTFINVTESGTEAAAATAVSVVTLSLPLPAPLTHLFTADHSFLYYIRNKENATLFIGRYVSGEK